MDRTVRRPRGWLVALVFAIAGSMGIAPAPAQQLCGGVEYPFPYTDVSGVGPTFCPGIMEAYVVGISKGTTPTTFSPNDDVPRVQMTTFLQRTVDQVLARGSRRGALGQWWTPVAGSSLQTITLATGAPNGCSGDGANIWTVTTGGNLVKVDASTGANLAHWTGIATGTDVLAAAGRVFAVAGTSPGTLYVIDPTQAPGAAPVAASNLGDESAAIAFDGVHVWTANVSGSVSIITPAATTPYPPGNVTTVTTGFTQPVGILYDGSHIWVTDYAADALLQLDAAGAVLKTVVVGTHPGGPTFDGANIWVPNIGSNSISVVQASTGTLVATIAADATNMLDGPNTAAFDGERVLITNFTGQTVTVFKAADLSFIANVATEPGQGFSCSDGINFWIAANDLLRF
jgi:hypothetical protein